MKSTCDKAAGGPGAFSDFNLITFVSLLQAFFKILYTKNVDWANFQAKTYLDEVPIKTKIRLCYHIAWYSSRTASSTRFSNRSPFTGVRPLLQTFNKTY